MKLHDAMNPPMSPPSATPRFIVTRCVANTAWRRSAGASAETSVDCAGQNDPLPRPATPYSTNACHAECTSGKSATAPAITHNAIERTRRGPIRSEKLPATKPDAKPQTELVAATRPAIPSGTPRSLCR